MIPMERIEDGADTWTLADALREKHRLRWMCDTTQKADLTSE